MRFSRPYPQIPDDASVLVLYGDVPLTARDTLHRRGRWRRARCALALVTVELEDPTGYGRIVRDAHGAGARIVEQKDAPTPEQLEVREINSGILCAAAGNLLKTWLWLALSSDNAQGEYYLTDVIAMAAAESRRRDAVKASGLDEVLGVNDRVQLAAPGARFSSANRRRV